MIHPFHHLSLWAERRMLAFGQTDRSQAFNDVDKDTYAQKMEEQDKKEGTHESQDESVLTLEQKATRKIRETKQKTGRALAGWKLWRGVTKNDRRELAKEEIAKSLGTLADEKIQQEIDAALAGLNAGASEAERVIHIEAIRLNRVEAVFQAKIDLCDASIKMLKERIDLLKDEKGLLEDLGRDVKAGILRDKSGKKVEYKTKDLKAAEGELALIEAVKKRFQQEKALNDKFMTKEKKNRQAEDEDARKKIDGLGALLIPRDPAIAGDLEDLINNAVADGGEIEDGKVKRENAKKKPASTELEEYVSQQEKDGKLTPDQAKAARNAIQKIRNSAAAKRVLRERIKQRDDALLTQAGMLNPDDIDQRITRLATCRVGQQVDIQGAGDVWTVVQPKMAGSRSGMTYLRRKNGDQLIIERTKDGADYGMTLKDAETSGEVHYTLKAIPVCTVDPSASPQVKMNAGLNPRELYFEAVAV